MSIQHIIVHEIRRVKVDKKGTENLIVKIKDKENDLRTLNTALSEGLLKLFSKSSLMVGQFSIKDDADRKPAFEQVLDEFYDGEMCLNFVEMTNKLAEYFKKFLEANKNISGGFLVFFEFKGDEHTKLAVAVINKSTATDVDNNLDFIAKEILDLEKLHLGTTINITEWQAKIDERYIRFKNGQSENVTDYFQKFIGCEVDKEAADEETKKLREAIEKFASEELKLSQDDVDQHLLTAYTYINECIKKGDDIVLDNVSKHVFPSKSTEFFEFASDGHNLSGIIHISTSELKGFQKFSSTRKNLSITFARNLLHDKIKYEDGILRIEGSLLSDNLVAELEAASALGNKDK